MRALALLFLLTLGGQVLAADSDELACRPTAQHRCSADGRCTTQAEVAMEVRFWPLRTPGEGCRAAYCPPSGPSIFVCGPESCGSGAFRPVEERGIDTGLLKGMAYVAPDPGPAISATRFYALAFQPSSGTLVLSRFDPDGLETTWLACVAAPPD